MRLPNDPNIRKSFVGAFWFVRGASRNILLIAHGCPLEIAEEYGRFLTCPHGHFDLWEHWRTQARNPRLSSIVRASEYEEWPRGRVVFDSIHDKFLVYANQQVSARKSRE